MSVDACTSSAPSTSPGPSTSPSQTPHAAYTASSSPTKSPSTKSAKVSIPKAAKTVLTQSSSEERLLKHSINDLTCFPNARVVKFHQPNTKQPIQLFEVEVIDSTGTNAAAGTATLQSSTDTSNSGEDYFASNAVDGDVTTFSRTNDKTPWLEIDLGESVPVTSVSILNRWCENSSDPTACLCSLTGAALSLIDESGEEVTSITIGSTCEQPTLEFVFDSSSDFCKEAVSAIALNLYDAMQVH